MEVNIQETISSDKKPATVQKNVQKGSSSAPLVQGLCRLPREGVGRTAPGEDPTAFDIAVNPSISMEVNIPEIISSGKKPANPQKNVQKRSSSLPFVRGLSTDSISRAAPAEAPTVPDIAVNPSTFMEVNIQETISSDKKPATLQKNVQKGSSSAPLVQGLCRLPREGVGRTAPGEDPMAFDIAVNPSISMELNIPEIISSGKKPAAETGTSPKNMCQICKEKITTLSHVTYLVSPPTILTIGQELSDCIPELDLSIRSNAVICSKCANIIKYFYGYICIQSEVEIKKYIQQTQNAGKVNLVEVFKFHQPHNTNFDMNFKLGDFEVRDDLVCDNGDKAEENVEETHINSIAQNCCPDITESFHHLRKINVYPCYSTCGYKAENKSELILHLKYHTQKHIRYNKIISKRPARRYKNVICSYYRCSSCNYLTKYKSLFDIHSRIHTTKDYNYKHIFKCGIQIKSFDNTNNTNYCNKINMKHSKRKCTNRYYSKKNLKNQGKNIDVKQLSKHRYLRIHTEEKPFSCSVCEYQCNQKSTLNQHMRIHTGEKPFSCSVCEYQCSQKSSLKRHMQIHTAKKQFSCSVCEYQCRWKQDLIQHMRIHPTKKLLSCSSCNFQSNYTNNLKRHILTHTGVKPFSCFDCEYQCSQKSSLKRHMQIHTAKL